MKEKFSMGISASFILCLLIVSFFPSTSRGADVLPPPLLKAPGGTEEEWQPLSTLTPRFEWEAVPGATRYGLYISKYTDQFSGYSTLVFDSETPVEISITGTSFDLPAGFLKPGIKYRWNMRSFNGENWGPPNSDRLYFSTSIANGGARGIDVSKWQDRIAWDQVCSWRDSGGRRIEFAYVRATRGTETDSWLNPNMEAIAEYNRDVSSTERLLVGVYHFAEPLLHDAVSSAEYFVTVAGDYIKPGFLRPMLDFESELLGTKELNSQWINQFVNTVIQKTGGVEPIVYTLPNSAKDNFDDSVGIYDLWTTHPQKYSTNPDVIPYTPAPVDYFPDLNAYAWTSPIWSSWVIWQYGVTDYYNRNLPGINADERPETYAVDLDVFNGDRASLEEELLITGASPLDVYILVDLTSSFNDDLPIFKVEAPNMILRLSASNIGSRFGLGRFEDYPISPFGGAASGDKAYERLVDLTFDTDAVLSCISGLSTRWGNDGPESQYAAFYQAATGAGQDLSGVGFSGASIPPGQQANFRKGARKLLVMWTDAPFHNPGDPGSIPYPGPSYEETIEAIKSLDPPMVIGISSGSGGMEELKRLALDTGAVAPAAGVDTNGDGTIDILGGEPLVCEISSSGVGIAEAIESLVEATTILPIAEANGPYGGEVGKSILLNGSGSLDTDGYIALYEWDFEGDGVFDLNTTESSVSHVYETNFSGVVVLRVTDNDGNTAADEATIIINPALIGDVNQDGRVDLFDTLEFAIAFGSCPTSETWNAECDLNQDMIVDIFDVIVVCMHFGETSS
jgi:GH25 family lysozyme M1 (1,4-beta-N-acetylmuramidase)